MYLWLPEVLLSKSEVLFVNFRMFTVMQPITAKPSQNVQQLKISVLNGKIGECDEDPVIKQHLWFCDGLPDFKDFSILATNT